MMKLLSKINTMIILTTQEIAQFRSQLSEYPTALEALDTIEDCEGDLEDAAISLAIQVGQMPTTSENWLDGLAKRCRVAICQSEFREELLEGTVSKIFQDVLNKKVCPEILVTPVILYVFKVGVNQFCQPLEYKL
jgi:hypothetical protein